MRIALDLRCAFKGMGGIGRYAFTLLQEYANADHQNEYFCYFTHLSPPEPLRLPKNFRVQIFESGMIDERFDQLLLPTVLEQDRIDLYHNPTFAVPLVRTGVRCVATVHDVVFKRHPELVETKLRHYLDSATRRSCKHAERLITVSHFSKREIVSLYSVEPDRISVIHNGVRVPDRNDAIEGAKHELQKFGLDPGGYVLYVGSIEPKKNVGMLLEAFSQVKRHRKGTPLKLALAGSRGAQEFPLEARVKELGIEDRVVALGYVSEELLQCLYAHALVFVYPSLYEGFGFPPLEAMARGVPTVVSDSSSLPEVVGSDAVIVKRNRPDKLAREINNLIGDPERCRQLSERGRKRAEEFTWKRSAQQHLELFETVVKSHESTAFIV